MRTRVGSRVEAASLFRWTRRTEHTEQKSPDEHQLLGRRPTSDVKMVQV